MKHILKLFIAVAGITFLFSACHKVDDLPFYGNGSAVTLSSSASSIAPAPADSNNTVVNFSWTDPKYAQDSSLYKFVLQIDSTGRGFGNSAYTKVITGAWSTSFLAKELNNIMLAWGFAYNTAYTLDVRVISSYGNNNEQYTSNTIQLSATTYKVPPKIVPPAHLYIVGSATNGGWNNPVPVPSQELARVDETTYMGVFQMSGGNEYLLLPVNGDWSHKYAVSNTVPPAAGGDFNYDDPHNFAGPATSGMYLIVVDFQRGKYTLTPYAGPMLPTDLFMVGDATPGGWNNPVPVPSQQFTRLNSVQFELTLPITADKQYLFLPVNGDWSHKYAVANTGLPGLAAGGYFGYDFSSNFPGPSVAGNYKFEVNFALSDPTNPATATFKATKL